MGTLTYSMITSLDGYVADETGTFDWAEPDAELHSFINDLTAPVGTHLYGRRMYETMAGWETAHTIPDQPDFVLDWARSWQAADKVVYSRTLQEVIGARTRLEHEFEPAAVAQLKVSSERDLTVSGPGIAAAALRAGLVDEISQFVAPAIIGGGTHFLPGGIRLGLDLREERAFASGFVYLRYTVRS